VNYLGHAAVATWRTSDRAFVLGAMLPDFASMIGARLPAIGHPEIEAGVAFHYRTDAVFHRSLEFVALTRVAFGWLLERGVERGRARAVAHVGVELLLDSHLSGDERVQRAYLLAVESGAPPALGRHLSWANGRDLADFDALRDRLLARWIVSGEVDATTLALRVRRALDGRPRLALDDATERVARDWVIAARPIVAERVPALVRDLGAQLR
jgi:hypothetical protein